MGLNFNRFSINSQRWKNAISTGNFYRIRICLIFLQISQYRWQSKAESLVFLTTRELFLYVKYRTSNSKSKFDYLFFDTPCILRFYQSKTKIRIQQTYQVSRSSWTQIKNKCWLLVVVICKQEISIFSTDSVCVTAFPET